MTTTSDLIPPPTVTCCECGRVQHLRWAPWVVERLVERQVCYPCDLWLRHVDKASAPDQVRTPNGWLYTIGHLGSSVKGSAGEPFLITWLDESREPTRTNDLRCVGEIPERWRDRLAPNATVERAR